MLSYLSVRSIYNFVGEAQASPFLYRNLIDKWTENEGVRMNNRRKSFKMPHTYVILLGMALFVAILTWVIPAGEFERAVFNDRTVVVPGSYHAVEANPQGPWEFLQAIPQAFNAASEIIFFIFITGGAFAIINRSGMIQAGISRLARVLRGKEILVIPIFVFIFSLAGGTMGLSEETIVFIPIGIALAQSLGFDAMVGMGMITLGAAVGFYSGFMNPFTIGVAQGIAELTFTSGLWYRLIILAVLNVVTSAYLIFYARKIKQDPTQSILYNPETGSYIREEDNQAGDIDHFEFRHILILVVVLIGFALVAIGASQWGWYITEIAAIFLAMALISGLLSGLNLSAIMEAFLEGAADIISAALVVGVARTILVIMENGMISDTIINWLGSSLENLPTYIAVIGMLFMQLVINFFIPSGSGQAAATMPIMVPLADTLGLTRQTAVLAFQFGDGFMDSVMPSSGVLMAQLSMAKIPYPKYVKWISKLMIIWLIIGVIFLLAANAFRYGPF